MSPRHSRLLVCILHPGRPLTWKPPAQVKKPEEEHQQPQLANSIPRAEEERSKRVDKGTEMGAETVCNAARRSCSFLILVTLCFQLLLQQSQAFKLRVGYGEEEKVLLAVIVPDPTPELSSPAPFAAPPPLSGGCDDDVRPRLPTERSRRGHGHGEARRAAHAPAAAPTGTASSPGPARAPAQAEVPSPAPESGSGAALIKSSPAVPVPRGVADTATILPLPAPGEKRQEVGAAPSVGAGKLLPLLMLGFAMMASFGL